MSAKFTRYMPQSKRLKLACKKMSEQHWRTQFRLNEYKARQVCSSKPLLLPHTLLMSLGRFILFKIDDLRDQSSMFRRSAKKLKKKMWWKNVKVWPTWSLSFPISLNSKFKNISPNLLRFSCTVSDVGCCILRGDYSHCSYCTRRCSSSWCIQEKMKKG